MSKGLLGLAAGAVLTLLFVLACGADATSTPVPTRVPTPTTTAVQPTAIPTVVSVARPEGTLTIAMEDIGDGRGLPSASSGYEKHWALESPLRKTFDGRIVGGIVEAWDVSADGSKITLHIRKGTPFHTTFGDYGDVTAEDIQWSMEDGAKDGSQNGRASAWRQINGFKILDPYTLELDVTIGRHLLVIASMDMSAIPGIPILPKAYVEAVGEDEAGINWVGAGPWTRVSGRIGDRFTYEAIDDHFYKVPEFAELVLNEIPEAAVQLAAIKNGEADIALVSPGFVPEYIKLGVSITSGPGNNQSVFGFGGMYLTSRALPDVNCEGGGGDSGFNDTCGEWSADGAPWIADYDDPVEWARSIKVRLAMDIAIDRELICNTIFLGFCSPALIPGFYEERGEILPAWKRNFDLDRAKVLLAEGLKGTKWETTGLELDLLFTSRTSRGEPLLSEAVAQMWEKLGIKVNRKPEDPGSRAYRAASVNRIQGTDKPVIRVSTTTVKEEAWNTTQSSGSTAADSIHSMEHPTIEEMLTKISTTFDDAERRVLQDVLGKFLADNIGAIVPITRNLVFGIGPRLGDYQAPLGARDIAYPEFISKAK